jgi:hypothetical protein
MSFESKDIRKTSMIKLQVQVQESIGYTSTRLEIRTHMTDMLRVVFTQGTKQIVTRNLSTTRETVIVLMGNAPLRGYPF